MRDLGGENLPDNNIAEGKGVYREVESEGSWMWEKTNHGQISGLTDRNHIRGYA